MSCPTLCNPMEWQHARLPSPLLSPRVCSNSCPLSQWCHPTILTFASPFSFPQSFRASGSFPMSQFFALGGRSIGVSVSASVLINIQDWSPLGWTGWIFLQSKGYSQESSPSSLQEGQRILSTVVTNRTIRWSVMISCLAFCKLPKIFIFTLFCFTILYWFCHTLIWTGHGCTWVPNPEPHSHLPPHIISLDHPRALQPLKSMFF